MKKSSVHIYVIGGSGFIGSNYLKHVAGNPKIQVTSPTHHELDILDIKSLRQSFRTIRPDVVINFAAHRDANTAELQRGKRNASAWMTNVIGVKNIARVSRQFHCYLIHVSTDMVFSGRYTHRGPYAEDEKPETNASNLSWYGWTKAQGERALLGKPDTAIIRIGNVTKPVYDPKLDYVGKILYLFDEGRLYPLFYDQHLTLTSIPYLFDIIDKLVQKRISGVFHAASSDTFTPFLLGEFLIKKIRNKTKRVNKISIDTYLHDLPNRYPKYGGLLGNKTAAILRMKEKSWKQIVGGFRKAFI